jgi:hypothetical protein
VRGDQVGSGAIYPIRIADEDVDVFQFSDPVALHCTDEARVQGARIGP